MCWRGIARLVGHEGTHTHTPFGCLIVGYCWLFPPDRLSLAFEQEVESWTTLNEEMSLLDSQPAAGGTGFIDLPEEGFRPDGDDDGDEPLADGGEMPHPEGDGSELEYSPESPMAIDPEPAAHAPAQTPVEVPSSGNDFSSDSISIDRMRLESTRAAARAVKSSALFKRREENRRKKREQDRLRALSETRARGSK